jgi:1-acyl-sn-glycerol-3-phosphate acyltransferase
VLGKEHLPADGAAIYGGNHLNALMDALVLLSLPAYTMPVVFVARADIFANAFFVRALRFLKILPAYRIRNGYGNLGKNAEVFDVCADILLRKHCLGIMPEGNQTLERKMHTLAKGMFRIAFSAQERMPAGETVKLVPVGIDMGSLFHAGHHLILNIGKPIPVSHYMEQYRENPATALNVLRADYLQALRDVTVDYRTDNYYSTFEYVSEMADTVLAQQMFHNSTTLSRFFARQELATRLTALEERTPEALNALQTLVEQHKQAAAEARLPAWLFKKPPITYLKLLMHGLGMILTSGVFISGCVLSGLPFLCSRQIVKALKLKEKKFVSSIYYAVSALITFPFFYLLNITLFLTLMPCAWWWVFPFICVQYPLGRAAFFWYHWAQKMALQVRYRRFSRKNPVLMDTIVQLQKAMLSNVLREV